jgi:ribonuclease HI
VTGRRLLVEADGGSRGNPGPAGYGALVRDAGTGEVLAEVGEAIGRATNNVAEYRGLLAGLRAAAAIDPGATVEVRMDSKLVVEQMSGRWQVKHPGMRDLANQARSVLPPGQVTYTWVPRALNAAADRLANQAMDGEPVGVVLPGSQGSQIPGSGRRANGGDHGAMLPGMSEDLATTPPPATDGPRVADPDRSGTPEHGRERLPYRLLTGEGDRAFCERVSRALEEGWVLYGDPAVSFSGDRVLTAQAVVLPDAEGRR